MDNTTKRSALTILGELANGQVIAELTEELHKAHAAAMATGRVATVSVKLVIKPVPQATPGINPDMLTIVGEIATKLPKPQSDSTIFFVNQDGNISRNQDRQRELSGIREVGATTPSPSPQVAG